MNCLISCLKNKITIYDGPRWKELFARIRMIREQCTRYFAHTKLLVRNLTFRAQYYFSCAILFLIRFIIFRAQYVYIYSSKNTWKIWTQSDEWVKYKRYYKNISFIYTRNASLKHASKNAKKKLRIHQVFSSIFLAEKCFYNLYFI